MYESQKIYQSNSETAGFAESDCESLKVCSGVSRHRTRREEKKMEIEGAIIN